MTLAFRSGEKVRRRTSVRIGRMGVLFVLTNSPSDFSAARKMDVLLL